MKGKFLSIKALNVSGTSNTIFSLDVGKNYIIYSIFIWEGVLNYLIIGEENLPSWYPAELFNVVEKKLPFEWFCEIKSGEKLEALWGYKEMIFNEEHYDELLEREDNAIRIFLDRKKEIEEYFSI